MNMRQSELDCIFNTVDNVTGAVRDVSNIFNERFNDERCMYGSRRNTVGPQPYTHVPYGYGYGYSDNYNNNGFFQMNNNSGGGNITQGYPGFYNPAYGGGMY